MRGQLPYVASEQREEGVVRVVCESTTNHRDPQSQWPLLLDWTLIATATDIHTPPSSHSYYPGSVIFQSVSHLAVRT